MEMANLCQLCCLLEGDTNPFEVIADIGQNMFQLKDLIQGKKGALRSVDSLDIILWKVSMFHLPMYTFCSCCIAHQSYRDQSHRDSFWLSSMIPLRVFHQPETANGYHLKLLSPRYSQGLSTHYHWTTNWWVCIDQVSRQLSTDPTKVYPISHVFSALSSFSSVLLAFLHMLPSISHRPTASTTPDVLYWFRPTCNFTWV